jgi:hypothetical protein
MPSKFNKLDFRTIAPKWKLVNHLDRALMDFDEAWEFKYEPKTGDTAWHPSGHCVSKPTELYEYAQARLNGESGREAPGIAFRKAGHVGHFWHQLLQYVTVEKLGFATWNEIEAIGKRVWKWDLEYKDCTHQNCGSGHGENCAAWGLKSSAPHPYHWATGAADIAPCHIPKHGDYLVDFKTMSSQHYRSPSLPEFFALKYECQINIYMDWFDLEKGLIVAIQKESPHDFREVEFRRDQELIDAIYAKWQFVSDCLDAGEAPDFEDDERFKLPIKSVL